MPTNINFDKKLGFVNGTSIVLPSGPGGDFSTKSLSFDGVDDYVDMGRVTSLESTSNFSLSLWVKPTDFTKGRICGKYVSGQFIFLSINSSGSLGFSVTSGVTAQINTVTALSLNTWINVCAVFDGSLTASERLKIYIDGTLQSVTLLNTPPTSTGSLNVENWSYGKITGLSNFLAGGLDELAIYDYSLTASQAVSIYNNGKPADLTSLNPTSWYRAGESSTFAYPQILMPEDTNKNKLSKYSLDFDGLSYIDCGDPDEFSFGNGSVDSRFSLSAWVKISNFNSAHIIFEKRDYANNNNNFEYVLAITSAGGINNNIYDNNVLNRRGRKTSDGLISLNTWYHIAMTYNGVGGTNASDGIKTYLNGVRVDNADNQKNIYTAMHNTNQPFQIGRILAGNIDEASVFDVELSQPDVQAIYNSGVPTDISSYSPLGYWKLGEEAKFTDNWLVPNSALSSFSKYSFNFDGLDDYIDVANGTTIGRTQNISYSIWVNLVDGTARQYLVGNWTSSNGGTGLSIETSNTLVFLLGDGSNDSYFNSRVTNFTTYAPNNTWNHILATWDGIDAKIYINGVLRNTWTPTSLTISNWNTFHIARRGASTTSFLPNGKLDEVAIWDSGLSAGEVTAIYNGGNPKDLSGNSPVSWWRMGEEATYDGTTNQFTIPDQAGTNNGTSSNTMLLETLVGDTPQYYGGGISDSMDIFDRVGDAPVFTNNFSLEFDGLDDYVELNSPSSIQSLTSEITISFWIKAPRVFNTNYYTPASKGEYAAVGSQWSIRVNTANARNTSGGIFSVFPNANAITDNSSVVFPTPVDDNQWHHMMFVNDGTDLKVYIDGQLDATGTGRGRTLYDGNRSLKLGKLTNTSSTGLLQGNLDEVAIFGTALGLSDAQTIYNGGVPNNISSLSPVSWWRFEEGSGTTAKDSGSGGNDGTHSTALGPLYDTDRIPTPKANNTVSFNMEEADIVEDTP
jgi:hypothetical protein